MNKKNDLISEEFINLVGNLFANVQMIDLGAPYVVINTPTNQSLAKKDLIDSLNTLITQKQAKLFVYSKKTPFPGQFCLNEPFIPFEKNFKKIIFSPFCQAGRNRSQVLNVLLHDHYDTKNDVVIRPPHGILCGLDPYQNKKDGSWSYLEDKSSFLQTMEDKNDDVMFNASQKGFFERFGRMKTHRFFEDEVMSKYNHNWDDVALGDDDKSQKIRKEMHDNFTKEYYNLKENETVYVFIGFAEAFHQVVKRIMESNPKKENFNNLVFVILDYVDLIACTNDDKIPNFSEAAYDNLYKILEKNFIKK